MKRAEREARLAEMVHLYKEERLTLEEVGRRYGLSRQRVHQIFLAGGVFARTHADAADLAAARNQAVPAPVEHERKAMIVGRAPSQRDRGWRDNRSGEYVQTGRV